MDIVKNDNLKMESLLGAEFKKGTLARYRTSLKHTIDFLKWNMIFSDNDISKIDRAVITKYDFYLRSVRKSANNSAVKYLKSFGKIIRICLSTCWISIDPFLNYKNKVKKIDQIYLNTKEIQIMADKQLATERLT